MKKITITLLMLLTAAVSTEAKSWKIGPGSVVGMDFASINAAMSSTNVTDGDTLYLDQYYSEKNAQNVTKRVVIIGTGYDTSLTDEQVVATLTNGLNLNADGIVVKSCKLSSVHNYNNDCTLERCYATLVHSYNAPSETDILHIYSCYISGKIGYYNSSSAARNRAYDIQNSVIIQASDNNMEYMTNSIINNNTIINNSSNINYCIYAINNSKITNNIILNTRSSYASYDLGGGVYAAGSGNSIEHNILSRGSLSNYPNNKGGGTLAELFTQTGTFSDYYRLKDDSPAKGYATDGGDVGCHGGMFGCPSGGRSQYIPYFTKVVVGQRTEGGKLPVSVTVKIQDQ